MKKYIAIAAIILIIGGGCKTITTTTGKKLPYYSNSRQLDPRADEKPTPAFWLEIRW